MLSVLIVDDEPLARKNLQIHLQSIDGILPPKIAQNGFEALSLVEEQTPDLIITDIDMPGMSGIELAQKVNGRCEVCFVTAYSKFAVQAFDIEAIDYVLKPISAERLTNAITKAKKKIQKKSFSDYSHIAELLQSLKSKSVPVQKKISVRKDGRFLLLSPDSISHVTGAGNHVEIHTLDGNQYMHKAKMADLEAQLNPAFFNRVSRSIIINERCVTEIRKNENSDYLIHLSNDAVLHLSRRKKHALNRLLNQR